MSSGTRPSPAATRIAGPRAEPARRRAPRRALAVRARTAAAALALAASACSLIPGYLTDEEERLVSTARVNSKAYYEVGDYARAEDQCRRGLDLDDDDRTLRLTLGYALLMQARPAQIEEAVEIFDREIGPFGTDDWRVRLGAGIANQQLARIRAASDDPEQAARATRLRERARAELDLALQSSEESMNTPPEVLYHLALLDLEQDRLDLFAGHAPLAIDRLRQQDRVLEVQLPQIAGAGARVRAEHERAVNRERGRRLARESARIAGTAQDWSGAATALDALEGFGGLDRPDFFDRANLRERAGDLEGAVADYERFLAQTSGDFDENVRRAVDSLTRLRSELAELRTGGRAAGGR